MVVMETDPALAGESKMKTEANIIDRADTMRQAAYDLADEYFAEGNGELADTIVTMFDQLPDESAARLLGILEKCFGVTR